MIYRFDAALFILMKEFQTLGGEKYEKKMKIFVDTKYEKDNEDEIRITADELICFMFPETTNLTEEDEVLYDILLAASYLQEANWVDSARLIN